MPNGEPKLEGERTVKLEDHQEQQQQQQPLCVEVKVEKVEAAEAGGALPVCTTSSSRHGYGLQNAVVDA